MANDVNFNTSVSGAGRNPFLKSPRAYARILSRVLAHQTDAGTDMGLVEEGTLLEELSSGRVRPCAKSTANGAVSAATTITLVSTKGFRQGDPIFDDGVDTTRTVASITSDTVMEASGTVTIADGSVVTWKAAVTALGIADRDTAPFLTKDANFNDVNTRKPIDVIAGGATVRASSIKGDYAACAADLPGITFE